MMMEMMPQVNRQLLICTSLYWKGNRQADVLLVLVVVVFIVHLGSNTMTDFHYKGIPNVQ